MRAGVLADHLVRLDLVTRKEPKSAVRRRNEAPLLEAVRGMREQASSARCEGALDRARYDATRCRRANTLGLGPSLAPLKVTPHIAALAPPATVVPDAWLSTSAVGRERKRRGLTLIGAGAGFAPPATAIPCRRLSARTERSLPGRRLE